MDNDIRVGQSTKIDPVLRLYVGCHLMVINSNVQDTMKVGNGSQCQFRGPKLRNDNPPSLHWKNWDDQNVRVVSAEDVEWIEL